MGVAGGELLIPTIVLLYAVDIKTAGSLSLVVSLPTMLVAFARYSRDQLPGPATTALRRRHGARVDHRCAARRHLLGVVPTLVLIPLLVLLILMSAIKVWRHS